MISFTLGLFPLVSGASSPPYANAPQTHSICNGVVLGNRRPNRAWQVEVYTTRRALTTNSPMKRYSQSVAAWNFD